MRSCGMDDGVLRVKGRSKSEPSGPGRERLEYAGFWKRVSRTRKLFVIIGLTGGKIVSSGSAASGVAVPSVWASVVSCFMLEAASSTESCTASHRAWVGCMVCGYCIMFVCGS